MSRRSRPLTPMKPAVDQQRDEYNELRNQWRTDIIPLLHRAYIMDKALREKVDNAENTGNKNAD